MTKATITVKLCSTKIPFEIVSDGSYNDEIQVSLDEDTKETSVVVPIKHVVADGIEDCESSNKIIQIPLIRSGLTDTEVIDCLWPEPPEFNWFRGINNLKELRSYITIDWSNPQENCADCLWHSSTIMGHNPDSIYPIAPFIVKKFRVPVLGEIPQDSSESYWMAPLYPEQTHDEEQPNVAPGEKLELYWAMRIDNRIYQALMSQKWFNTPLITGGTILSVIDEGETTQTWMVDVEGDQIVVVPTDFAQYDVGSWVYLFKQNTAGKTYDRNTVYEYDGDIDANARPIPLDFSGSKPVSGSFETKNFDLSSDFSKAFEICYHDGILTDVNSSNNSADVTVTVTTPAGSTDQDFSDVPIFYHCPDTEDTSKGGSAFIAGDSVIVLNENTDGSSIDAGDLSIVGFKDELKQCAKPALLIVTFSTGCFVYDIETEMYATTVTLNSGGFASFPCELSDISLWIANKTVVVVEDNQPIYQEGESRIANAEEPYTSTVNDVFGDECPSSPGTFPKERTTIFSTSLPNQYDDTLTNEFYRISVEDQFCAGTTPSWVSTMSTTITAPKHMNRFFEPGAYTVNVAWDNYDYPQVKYKISSNPDFSMEQVTKDLIPSLEYSLTQDLEQGLTLPVSISCTETLTYPRDIFDQDPEPDLVYTIDHNYFTKERSWYTSMVPGVVTALSFMDPGGVYGDLDNPYSLAYYHTEFWTQEVEYTVEGYFVSWGELVKEYSEIRVTFKTSAELVEPTDEDPFNYPSHSILTGMFEDLKTYKGGVAYRPLIDSRYMLEFGVTLATYS